MPALFLILDEFSELLTAKPEFAELFVAIGRLGRSLSIHLLLASQRLETSGCAALSLTCPTAWASRPSQPASPARFWACRTHTSSPRCPAPASSCPARTNCIRSVLVRAAPPPQRTVGSTQLSTAGTPDRSIKVLPFTLAPVLTREEPIAAPASSEEVMSLPGDAKWADMSELDIAVAKMTGKGVPAHQVWLPPLDVPDTFDQMMPDLAPVDGIGFVSWSGASAAPSSSRWASGTSPLEQRRDLLTFDLSGAGGNSRSSAAR